MAMEVVWVGKVDDVDAQVYYGQEVVQGEAGPQVKEVWVDGWLLPVFEAKREQSCEYHPLCR